VSPDFTVYVKGVGEGKGVVTETTNPSGWEAVEVEVKVRYGLIFFGTGVAPDTLVPQAAENKRHRIINFRMR
jgi:hypothetical protein